MPRQKAEVIKRNGQVSLSRYETVILTGSRVNVSAAGDNRVCRADGNVKLTFGKGRQNRAALGSGNDSVFITSKASANFIDLGDGNNRIRVKNKAVTHSIKGGSGRDNVLIAYKTVNAIVNTGAGDDNVVLAAKATRQKVSTGLGDDRITVQKPAKTNDRDLDAGLGNDVVKILAKGNTTTYLSDTKNPGGLSDTDTFSGGRSIDRVFDYFGGTATRPNLIRGNGGLDYLRSLGSARSEIHGGDGTDFIYAASSGVSGDRIFGDRGNDRLRADQGGGDAKGAYLDPGDGDDWVYGTDGDDLIVSVNGIEKVYANGGDDKIIKTGNGIGNRGRRRWRRHAFVRGPHSARLPRLFRRLRRPRLRRGPKQQGQRQDQRSRASDRLARSTTFCLQIRASEHPGRRWARQRRDHRLQG